MERLKQMKESLMACTASQVCGNLNQVDTKELGEAIDMIKDLEEAIYYATITKAMEEKPEKESYRQEQQQQYYPVMRVYPQDDSMGRLNDKLYYNGGGNGSNSYYTNGRDGDGNSSGRRDGQSSNYFEPMYMADYRDVREGNSPIYRKMYMESKEMHHDKTKQMQELEDYMQELSKDITDMIKDSSPEEKQLLQQKLTNLASKIKQQ